MSRPNRFREVFDRLPELPKVDLAIDALHFTGWTWCECGILLTWSRTLQTAIADRDPSDSVVAMGDVAPLVTCSQTSTRLHEADYSPVIDDYSGYG
ncbi:hypothetical protein ETD86_29480 [Nonomuraea turkmeniaca]|uniref:Uncharacterized protein n=1 Tax=Nonomuraea turkmeniaca TaxID=103838 RepID=A0A5S4FUT7_9ACTN|nr:hypothetical protein [Nonomuraea turkmeniaca]TMR14080.1 hypothetical protein ETD86_29480 [Nonomuraea turkmeniaca]